MAGTIVDDHTLLLLFAGNAGVVESVLQYVIHHDFSLGNNWFFYMRVTTPMSFELATLIVISGRPFCEWPRW